MVKKWPIFQQKLKVLKEMSIISWCVFMNSRASFTLFYSKHGSKNQLLFEQWNDLKSGENGFFHIKGYSKGKLRKNGSQFEKFKVSNFQKVTKMAFLIKNNWPRVITLLRLTLPFRTRFEITHFCGILGIFLFLSCHGLRCQDPSG